MKSTRRLRFRQILLIALGSVLAVAMLVVLAWSGLAQQGNATAADMLLRLDHRTAVSGPQEAILLAIDDETVSRYGPLPISRALISEALTRVAVAKPSVLVVDMLL